MFTERNALLIGEVNRIIIDVPKIPQAKSPPHQFTGDNARSLIWSPQWSNMALCVLMLGCLTGLPGPFGQALAAITEPTESTQSSTSPATQRALDEQLVEAAVQGNAAAIARLLKAGASPNAREKEGRTGLMLVVAMGHEVVEQVVQEGFGARVVVEGLPAPAVTESQVKGIELFIEHGADIEALDNNQETALLLAAARDYAPIVERLLAAGASPDAIYASGLPVSSLTAARGFGRTLKLLIDAGAAIDVANSRGKLPLHYAVAANHIDTVRILLTHGIPVDVKTTFGWTALHIAASRGYRNMVELLLTSGADHSLLTTREQLSAEQLARSRGHNEVAGLLAASSRPAQTSGESMISHPTAGT